MTSALRDARQGQDGTRLYGEYGKNTDKDDNQRSTCVADFRDGTRKEKLRVADDVKTCVEVTP